MTALTMTCGWMGGAKKLNIGDVGSFVLEKSLVRVNEGSTRVVRIEGVRYLKADRQNRPIGQWTTLVEWWKFTDYQVRIEVFDAD